MWTSTTLPDPAMVKGPKLTARDSVAGESAIVNGPVPSITLNVLVAMTNPSHWSPEENWLILTSTLLPSESYRCPTMAEPLGLCVRLLSVQTRRNRHPAELRPGPSPWKSVPPGWGASELLTCVRNVTREGAMVMVSSANGSFDPRAG
jgi:hypothetical protein